jgi:hypothetical protein
VPGGDRRQGCQGERRGQRTGCRSVVPWPGQALGVRAIRGCRWRGPCWQRSTIGSSVGPSFSRSVKPATKATTAPGSSGAGWRSPARVPRRTRDSATAADRSLPWPGQALGVRADPPGCRWRGPCWQRSTIGSSVGPSFYRSVKPATRRRRRQGRAVPGGDRRQVGQVEGETAYRLPIGVAVAWSGSRGAGNPRLPLAWPVLAALDHRQFGRAFVLSIGEAGHEATTAPGSSGAGWRSPASGASSNAGQRNGCRSVVPWPGQALGVRAIRGCRWRGPCWQRSITGSSAGPSSSRSVKPATRRRRRQRQAGPGGDRWQEVPGRGETAYRLPIGVAVDCGRGFGVLAVLDHRQFGRAFVLSIGEAGHEATMAPASSGAWWRSPASGPGRTRDSAPAADRGCRGLWSWCRGAGNPRLPPAWPVLAVLDHRQFGRAFVFSIGEAGHEATTAPASRGA